ncbi:hypothetical protein MPS01_18180 [Marinilactibacillus psychrotolerans]|nr:hypothetical protein MPS01_18180 [Marinilactibacillus psychrotolerans]
MLLPSGPDTVHTPAIVMQPLGTFNYTIDRTLFLVIFQIILTFVLNIFKNHSAFRGCRHID